MPEFRLQSSARFRCRASFHAAVPNRELELLQSAAQGGVRGERHGKTKTSSPWCFGQRRASWQRWHGDPWRPTSSLSRSLAPTARASCGSSCSPWRFEPLKVKTFLDVDLHRIKGPPPVASSTDTSRSPAGNRGRTLVPARPPRKVSKRHPFELSSLLTVKDKQLQ